MFFHLNHFPSVYTIQTQFFPANRGRWSIFVDVNPQRDAAAQFRLLGKKKKRQHNVQHISPKCTYACNCISHILKNNVRFKAQLNYFCPGYLRYLQKLFLLKGIVLLRRLLIQNTYKRPEKTGPLYGESDPSWSFMNKILE